MFKRIIFLIPLMVIIIGCSNLEFVYNTSFTNTNKIKDKTLFSVTGDNKDIISNYFLSQIGKVENNPVYSLSVVSISSINAEVVETDATASKFMIKHDLKYTLNNIKNNCTTFEKSILTKNSYDAKSAGYSFGTDLAEKELSIKNLHSNINQFLKELLIDDNNLKCKNES